MLINFNEMPERTLQGMNGGTDDINYVISGTGKAIRDGVEELAAMRPKI